MEGKFHFLIRLPSPAGRNRVLACVLVDPANDKSQSLLLPAALSIITGKNRYGWNEEEAGGGRAGREEGEKRKMNPGKPVLR